MSDSLPEGTAQAAAVLLTLDEATAAEVLRHIGEEHVKTLAETVNRLDPKSDDELEEVLRRFARLMRDPTPVRFSRASEHIRDLAVHALGPVFDPRPRAPTQIGPSPFDRIRHADPRALAILLEEEHPQVAAAVVSQLQVDQAKTILDTLTEERRVDLLSRISTLEKVPRELIQEASAALAHALDEANAIDGDSDDDEFNGVVFAADLLKQLPGEESENMLAKLEERSEEATRKVREAMFGFEDLKDVTVRGLQQLMKEVSTDQLLPALKTASDELKEKFFSSVSSRAAETLREDLELLRPMRLSEVEEAQRAIVDVALRLGEEGRINLPMGGAEELV